MNFFLKSLERRRKILSLRYVGFASARVSRVSLNVGPSGIAPQNAFGSGRVHSPLDQLTLILAKLLAVFVSSVSKAGKLSWLSGFQSNGT